MHRRLAPYLLRAVILAMLLASVNLGTGGGVAAAAQPDSMPGKLYTLLASGDEVDTYVPPPATLYQLRASSAQFIVTYSANYPANAKAAFQYAVDIWSSLLTTTVPIRVQANWAPLGGNTLGQAGALNNRRNFAGAPFSNTWYPNPLANKLAGTDLAPAEDDITATFNSSFGTWYFGNGTTPAGQVNFTSVVLHEIGHGLGFSGSMDVNGANGSWGFNASPDIYDRFAVDGGGQSLINTAIYPNPSAALGTALRSNAVYFNGSAAVAANGGTAPRLYAPNAWAQGSSYSHFNETTYPAGNANALMTPSISNGEAIYSPGPVGLGLLQDLGWTVVQGNPAGTSTLTVTTSGSGNVQRSPAGDLVSPGVYSYPTGSTVVLTPQATGGQSFIGWIVDGKPAGWNSSIAIALPASRTVQAIFASPKTFNDVSDDRGDYAAIVSLATRGYIAGYNATTYAPANGITRAEMAALIARATPAGPGTPPATTGTATCATTPTWDCEIWPNTFTDKGDLVDSLWRDVAALQHYEVARGYTDADCARKGLASPCYAPNASVSYVETIAFITRAMEKKGYWVAQPGAPQPYAGIPDYATTDVATFYYYTQGAGGILDRPGDWNAGATRSWFARQLWQALNAYWGSYQP